MAEFMLKHLAAQAGRADEFEIASAAVSTEETGNDMYPPAKRKLREKGIPYAAHQARQITRDDYCYYDYIVCMDSSNLRLLHYIIGDDIAGKVSLLMSWVNAKVLNEKKLNEGIVNENVADPWYTGDFDATYRDLLQGCKAILNTL